MTAFAPGDRVRTRTVDPVGHTRLPRYARGAWGTVVQVAGSHPLADDRARGLEVQPQPVYHVRFTAADLFGTGDHTVTVELWHDHLEVPA
ncbi:Nitrile hydratase beta subunit [Klenkia soli]|uniref:Nitrile hydratase beta subunit n=1 Tax=Klenkia soli TaxID=1052260 RepID=A0A1H0C6G8_9ACTN|nr:Nitrile hydratase beta subunit [Klenkia soli]